MRTNGKDKAGAPASYEKSLEWVVGGVAFFFVVVLLGYLLGLGAWVDGQPPRFSIVVESVEQIGNVYQMQVVVTNEGDVTASDVTLRGVLRREVGADEARELRFDYLPQRSQRRGAFVFEQDPRSDATMHLFVTGYVEP
ncbi:uncharacterized protein (TIGR02588 family) [Chelatococcus caeni]|uniref:Uncharacterized protein (TIGR02588 family) n=1 Tax=Chelatococcus caeni TaxID=1348468 RepID=A0A840C0J2_9HYPH|nr:hypothetical protein [Chelatococcus caeni]MBB4016506.1 uncharacterized protein (TIGR02588 family) [Chelatococcus caeni]